MLVLSRKVEQTIMIGDDIEVTVLNIDGNQVRLGFKCPREIPILREELYDRGIRSIHPRKDLEVGNE